MPGSLQQIRTNLANTPYKRAGNTQNMGRDCPQSSNILARRSWIFGATLMTLIAIGNYEPDRAVIASGSVVLLAAEDKHVIGAGLRVTQPLL